MYSCTAPDNAPQKGITVSIEPLRYVTEQIAGNDFDIRVLVPPGSSPETYEPTPEQMKQVANSLAYIDIGLIDFERNLENAGLSIPQKTSRCWQEPAGTKRTITDTEPIPISGSLRNA